LDFAEQKSKSKVTSFTEGEKGLRAKLSLFLRAQAISSMQIRPT